MAWIQACHRIFHPWSVDLHSRSFQALGLVRSETLRGRQPSTASYSAGNGIGRRQLREAGELRVSDLQLMDPYTRSNTIVKSLWCLVA
jgi:hypothetical protein